MMFFLYIIKKLFRLYAEKYGLSSFWLGVTKVDGTWMRTTWEPENLDYFSINDADSVGDCIIADSNNEFKPKIVDCEEKHGVCLDM